MMIRKQKLMLFKRTSTGAVQCWRQEINEAGNGYRTISGQFDGKQVVSEWTICKTKNAGRSNATTAEEQTEAEVSANYQNKLDRGYFSKLNQVDNVTMIRPMLAKQYEDYPIVTWKGIYSQPKLDGIRCIARKSGLFSRQGKPFKAAPHIMKALAPMFEKFPNAILDGELYNHDLRNDFNEIVSLVKNETPNRLEVERVVAIVQYHVYDLPSSDAVGFGNRSAILRDMLPREKCLVLVPTSRVNDQERLDELYAIYLESGYEGQMVRHDAIYEENKRSKFLLKRKEFLDGEFEILEIEEGIGNRSGMAGAIRFVTDAKQPGLKKSGLPFKSGIAGGVEFYRELWKYRKELVGKMATVRYFKPTPDGVPRFPVTKVVHSTERL